VHISEEASNAAIAVPWAIVSAVGIAGVLGWGMYPTRPVTDPLLHDSLKLSIWPSRFVWELTWKC
jgi:hypothetical protein